MELFTPSSRFLARAKLLGRFMSIQFVAQGIGVLSGIILVRTLGRTEYALFTIANSMQGTMNLLADTGLSIGLTSIGGRVWKDRYRFGQLINTTMRLRRYLALVAVAAVSPILVWMLIANGASYRYAAGICLVVLISLNYQLVIGVFNVVPRLLSQVERLQTLDLMAALLRLVLILLAYELFLNAVVAAAATTATLLLQRVFLKKWAADGIDMSAPTDAEDRRAMLRIVRNQAPTAIFYCVQGQIIVWLMTVMGNTQGVADVGALGRLSIIFAVIASVMTTIVVPRFAKYDDVHLLRRRFVQIITGFALFGGALVLAAALFPGVLLWILGSKYAYLRRELLLIMVMTAANSVANAMWALNSAKAWIEYSWLNIPGTIAMQAVLLLVVNVSTLRGALMFGIFSVIPTFILNVTLAVRGLASVKRAAA
jgi:O-antigen/teichoic acid export membrane protein